MRTLLVAALIGLLPACAAIGKHVVSAEEASAQPYLLRAGDEVEIVVGGRTDSAVKAQIGPEGTVLYPAAGELKAAGRSIRELEQEIERLLLTQISPAEPEETHPAGSVPIEFISPTEAFNQTYQLQPGDQLDIVVWERSELSQKNQIREDGTFPYPLLGSVKALGRTTGELEKEIEERLNKDYIVNPQVTVRLADAQFTVLGQKGDSGTYPIEGTLDLMTAISKAGDILTLRTNPVEIIRRQGNKQVVIRANVDRLLSGKDPNIPVLPRDTIYVKPPTAGERKVAVRLLSAKFTALGEVNNPGSYGIEGTMDLLTAVSLAGGVSKFGSSSVEIIRSVGDQKVVIRADIDRILRGKASNPSILPRDTIYARRRLL